MQYICRTSRLIVALSLFFFASVGIVRAGTSGPISLYMTPDAPGPETPTVVTIESYAVDVRASYIIWTINGTKVAEGSGVVRHAFTTPGVGEEVTIEAKILTPKGKVFRETLVFRPSTVDILWQADTYVPPFYKGKALPSHKSNIITFAIPEFPGVDPKKVHYRWSVDRTTYVGIGTGVTSAKILATWEKSPTNLAVEAKSPDGLYRATHRVSPVSVRPEIYFYEDSPLSGTRFGRALSGSISVDAPEYTLTAAPYFFSRTNRLLGHLVFEWYIDNRRVRLERDTTERITILRNKDEDRPTIHRIVTKVYNKKAVTQESSGVLSLVFTNSDSQSIFGQ